jgi:hypothetical protein
VKALAIAASQGQKIYTITRANQDILLPQINVDPDVITEMQNALSAGKEVTVHQSPITQSGWTGTGYIITDPATGAGAYKISGGANGSYLGDWQQASSTIKNIATIVSLVVFLVPIFSTVAVVLPVATLILFSILASTALNLINLEITLSQINPSPCSDALLSIATGAVLINLFSPILAKYFGITLNLLSVISLGFISLSGTGSVVPANNACGKYQ